MKLRSDLSTWGNFWRLILDVLWSENDLSEVLHEAALDDLDALELGTQSSGQCRMPNASPSVDEVGDAEDRKLFHTQI